MIIIGSHAIRHYFPDHNRTPKDLDYAVEKDGMTSTKDVEYLYNPVIFKYSSAEYLEPDLMMTLKASHLFWDKGNFDKHLWDIQFLLDKGCEFNKELFYELYEFWTSLFGQPIRSNLNMTKEDFFNNQLKTYDHDYLHTLINPIPTYISMLKDGQEVDIDEEKFNKASREDKLNLIREEVSVMSFERFQNLNVPENLLYKFAYGKMLKKYIISHVPMFVSLFLLENYKEIYKPQFDFIKTIKEKL